MRTHVRTRTDFGSIRLIWQNLAEVDQAGRIWQNLVKASSSICRVFYRDIPTVTRLVPLHDPLAVLVPWLTKSLTLSKAYFTLFLPKKELKYIYKDIKQDPKDIE